MTGFYSGEKKKKLYGLPETRTEKWENTNIDS